MDFIPNLSCIDCCFIIDNGQILFGCLRIHNNNEYTFHQRMDYTHSGVAGLDFACEFSFNRDILRL